MLCFLCVNAQSMWSEGGVLEDLFEWKSGACMCFVILKRLGVFIERNSSERGCLAFSKPLTLLPSQFV